MLELAAIVASRDEGSKVIFDISFGEGKPELVLTFDRKQEPRFSAAMATFCKACQLTSFTNTEQLHNIPFWLKREPGNPAINLFIYEQPKKAS